MTRKCGTCSACCRWPAVAEIDKPAKTPCRYLRNKKFGCTIYSERPTACAQYRCSWLRGVGSTEDRPDRSHVLIDRRMTKFGLALVAKSLKPGAMMAGPGRRAIARATEQENILGLIVSDDDSEQGIGVAGPRELVRSFRNNNGNKPFVVGGLHDFIDDVLRQHGATSWPAM